MINPKNTVILTGNIGKDPGSFTFEDGSKKATFSLATSERYKDRAKNTVTQTQWHNIVCTGHTANFVEQYASKGSLVSIVGKLTYREYENKDGKNVRVTEVYAVSVELLGGKQEQSEPSAPAGESQGDPVPVDDDLPF